MPQAQNSRLTHASVSPTGWVKQAKQIEDYEQSHRPNGYSDLRVALHIVTRIAGVARKQGVQSYTELEVLKGSKDELAKTPANFTFASEDEAKGRINEFRDRNVSVTRPIVAWAGAVYVLSNIAIRGLGRP